MEERQLFSPLDLRYNKMLPWTLTEQALLEAQVEVERAWLEALMEAKICPALPMEKIQAAFKGIQQKEIDEIEARTQHATRALVETLMARLEKAGHKEQAKWVHVGLTSFDTVDTAYRLRLKSFYEKDFFPKLDALKKILLKKAKDHKDLTCVGRTHGQWAVPSLFGLSFAEAYVRLQDTEKTIRHSLEKFCGQASGAIGGYHASVLLYDKPLELEKSFLGKLNLKPTLASIQILPPEDICEVAQGTFNLSSVVAKVANDLRHLARSEIGEVAEGMAPGQVGSSTMPQKRNPWNLEHVCSLYKVLYSKLSLIEMDLVTEHQRDLTNSASGRFYSEFFAVAYLMLARLESVLQRLEVIEDNVRKNLDQAGSSVYAEAFYVLATGQGIEGAHSKIREAARESEKSGKTLFEICKNQNLLPPEITSVDKLTKKILSGSVQKLNKILEGKS